MLLGVDNARSLQCAIVLHESLQVPVLMYGSEIDIEEGGEVWD